MKLFYRGKDGGPESSVTGWWLIEAKKMFSIALLKFEGASMEAYHDHAFNSISWVLRGFGLYESFLKGGSRYLFPVGDRALPREIRSTRSLRLVPRGS